MDPGRLVILLSPFMGWTVLFFFPKRWLLILLTGVIVALAWIFFAADAGDLLMFGLEAIIIVGMAFLLIGSIIVGVRKSQGGRA